MLPKYGWYVKNSGEKTCPVGTKKPNDLGLFDVHGNIRCWCLDIYKDYPAGDRAEIAFDDSEHKLPIDPKGVAWRLV